MARRRHVCEWGGPAGWAHSTSNPGLCGCDEQRCPLRGTARRRRRLGSAVLGPQTSSGAPGSASAWGRVAAHSFVFRVRLDPAAADAQPGPAHGAGKRAPYPAAGLGRSFPDSRGHSVTAARCTTGRFGKSDTPTRPDARLGACRAPRHGAAVAALLASFSAPGEGCRSRPRV
jgi:hypothetical protein